MDLSRLIKAHEKLITIKDASTDGRYENGKWMNPPVIERSFYGCALPMTPKDLKFYEGGTYTTQDLKLFVVKDLMDIVGNYIEIAEGEVITVGDINYEISSELDASELAGYRKFVAKKVIIDD